MSFYSKNSTDEFKNKLNEIQNNNYFDLYYDYDTFYEDFKIRAIKLKSGDSIANDENKKKDIKDLIEKLKNLIEQRYEQRQSNNKEVYNDNNSKISGFLDLNNIVQPVSNDPLTDVDFPQTQSSRWSWPWSKGGKRKSVKRKSNAKSRVKRRTKTARISKHVSKRFRKKYMKGSGGWELPPDVKTNFGRFTEEELAKIKLQEEQFKIDQQTAEELKNDKINQINEKKVELSKIINEISVKEKKEKQLSSIFNRSEKNKLKQELTELYPKKSKLEREINDLFYELYPHKKPVGVGTNYDNPNGYNIYTGRFSGNNPENEGLR